MSLPPNDTNTALLRDLFKSLSSGSSTVPGGPGGGVNPGGPGGGPFGGQGPGPGMMGPGMGFGGPRVGISDLIDLLEQKLAAMKGR